MSNEPKEFSRAIENLIADLRQVPADRSRSKRRKTTDLGAVIAYRGVTPGNSLGITGFDIGLEVTQTKLENPAILKQAGGGDNTSLYVPKLHVQKGLPLGFDIGAFVSKVPGINATLFGAEGRYQIIEDGLTTPSLAVRVSGSKVTGVSQTSLSTVAVDLMISKKLTFVTPYAGVGSVRIDDKPKVGQTRPAKVTADLDARIQQPGTTAERFVRQVYDRKLFGFA